MTSENQEPLEALDHLLAQARVPVREDFSRQVMAALPVAPWQRQASKSRLWVAALVAAFTLGSVLLLGAGSGRGPVSAVAELFVTTLTAGAGFLAASWGGIGSAVDAALGGSPVAIVGLGAATAAAYFLLFALARRRRAKVVDKG